MSKAYPIQFGKNGEYELSESAMRHIVTGDTKVRPVNVDGLRTTEVALSGGLHTWEAWESFLVGYEKVVHLLEYNSDIHDDWFFARELQNGVITLKIPRLMFTGSAAKITMQPDNYYKSGYLWKTLFPIGYSEDDIVKVIEEAFDNIDLEDSTFPSEEKPAGVLYGYAQLDDPLKTLKLRIQLRKNQIQSVFPSWEQPASGNNGKPYSHTNSINFNISGSTLDYNKYTKSWGHVFQKGYFCLDSLLSLTPNFILDRPRRVSSTSIDNWRDKREKDLMANAPLMSNEELQLIETYLHDFICCKDPYGIQTVLYKNCLDRIKEDHHIFNASQLLENIAECVQVLTHSDLKHGTRRAMNFIIRFISMAVVHTGGLCTLMFKRILGEFIEAVVGHHDENSRREFFSALADSPCRAALYTEFDLSPFVKENNNTGLFIPGYLNVDIELKPEHLYQFVAFNLGENYLLLLSEEKRLTIAEACYSGAELQAMVADCMSFLSGTDFQFFIPVRLEPIRLEKKNAPNEDDLIAVVRDYSRMLVLYRQRIVMEDPEAYQAELDYEKIGTTEFFHLIRQKHKRQFVWDMHNAMLDEMFKSAEILGYKKLKEKIESTKTGLPKEVIPMPKQVPSYILKGADWITEPTLDMSNENLVRQILGE
ncbi:hypothetical protein ABVY78_004633 [Vibrio parahaemolyticus]